MVELSTVMYEPYERLRDPRLDRISMSDHRFLFRVTSVADSRRQKPMHRGSLSGAVVSSLWEFTSGEREKKSHN